MDRPVMFSSSLSTTLSPPSPAPSTPNCSMPPPFVAANPHMIAIIAVYSFVFLLAFVGNSALFLILCRNQWVEARRVHSLLLHMNLAHLIVTLCYMPKEILHSYTVAWTLGDTACRVTKFLDAFGIALGANVLICISLDRFNSIFFPFYSMKARKTVRRMIVGAWAVACFTSLPQLYLWRVAHHPCHKWYTQCVSGDFVKQIPKDVVFMFSILNIAQVYFVPLCVTLVCYSLILWRISSSSQTGIAVGAATDGLRRSNHDRMSRARSRTLKMAIASGISFFLCWSPYALALFVHFTTKSQWLPKEARKFLYAFAVFNSAVSPYLFGYFSFDIKRELRLLADCSTMRWMSRTSQQQLSHSDHKERQRSNEQQRFLDEPTSVVGVHRTAAVHYRGELPVVTTLVNRQDERSVWLASTPCRLAHPDEDEDGDMQECATAASTTERSSSPPTRRARLYSEGQMRTHSTFATN